MSQQYPSPKKKVVVERYLELREYLEFKNIKITGMELAILAAADHIVIQMWKDAKDRQS